MYETPRRGPGMQPCPHGAKGPVRSLGISLQITAEGTEQSGIRVEHSRRALGRSPDRNWNGYGGRKSGKYSVGHSNADMGHSWLHQAKTHAPKTQPGRMRHHRKNLGRPTSKGRCNRGILCTEKETALLRSSMSTG